MPRHVIGIDKYFKAHVEVAQEMDMSDQELIEDLRKIVTAMSKANKVTDRSQWEDLEQGQPFWKLASDQGYNEEFAGCLVPNGNHIPSHQLFHNNNSGESSSGPTTDWLEYHHDPKMLPSTTVIPYHPLGRGRPGYCSWCHPALHEVAPGRPRYNCRGAYKAEDEHQNRDLVEYLAQLPFVLCAFHAHHILTGEVLTRWQLGVLEEMRHTLKHPWNLSYAIFFIETRSLFLPAEDVAQGVIPPPCTGSWYLNVQLKKDADFSDIAEWFDQVESAEEREERTEAARKEIKEQMLEHMDDMADLTEAVIETVVDEEAATQSAELDYDDNEEDSDMEDVDVMDPEIVDMIVKQDEDETEVEDEGSVMEYLDDDEMDSMDSDLDSDSDSD